MSTDDPQADVKEFKQAVNMSLEALTAWLDTTHRHLAQRPIGDIGDTPWRYSLMNWGHDPQVAKF